MLDDLADVAEPDTYRTAALENNTVKISANTIDTYRCLVKHMKEENIVHHTYQAKTERAFKIVIRHLHLSVPLDDIKKSYKKRSYVPKYNEYITQTNKRPRIPILRRLRTTSQQQRDLQSQILRQHKNNYRSTS